MAKQATDKDLRVEITDAERIKYANRLAEVLEALEEWKQRRKTVLAELKAEQEGLIGELGSLRDVLITGYKL